jgi:hypothetical protein
MCFNCILVVFGVLTLLSLLASIDCLAGRFLDEREKPLLPVAHKAFEVVSPQQVWIDQV